jgi:hypothetical protein
MMYSEPRACQCGYPVTYKEIDDAHDPQMYKQFVTIATEGVLAGRPVTTDFCPQCKQELTLENTTEKQ